MKILTWLEICPAFTQRLSLGFMYVKTTTSVFIVRVCVCARARACVCVSEKCMVLFQFISEVWREFVGYSTDLEPTPVILSPAVGNNVPNHNVIRDENNRTCMDVRSLQSYIFDLKVKHWIYW